jgi:predicted cytidylate kinase
MRASVLTVSGLPGSGTSTACQMLRESLGWDYVNAGQIFRDMASEAGMTLAEMGAYAEQNPQVDLQLDERMIQVARDRPPVVLEGRMTGWMAVRGKLSAHKVWLQASAEIRAERIGLRDGDVAALEQMLARQASESQRYREHHGIDICDLSVYDSVINTEANEPPAVVSMILKALGVAT